MGGDGGVSEQEGSSPRGRGKRALGSRPPRSERLIPARAGKTIDFLVAYFCPRAHPRAGGENGVIDMVAQDHAGSSPRGRGKRTPEFRRLCIRGLIPARAGKTGRGAKLPRALPAHPRAGGENSPKGPRDRLAQGSSPRGRGKRAPHENEGHPWGLIPARAGKTCATNRMSPSTAAHPRAGGEN